VVGVLAQGDRRIVRYPLVDDDPVVLSVVVQGTTDFENGEFVRKLLTVLESRVQWARAVLTQ
jgi:hypothetical protein